MIVFDLRCGRAHVFEAWFGSSADFEAQNAQGMIACPLCGDNVIGKAAMAPAVGPKSNSVADTSRQDLLAAQRRMEASSDYVGGNFAAQARAQHDGKSPARSIYGEATIAQAAALMSDGIAVMPLPFRPLVRSDA